MPLKSMESFSGKRGGTDRPGAGGDVTEGGAPQLNPLSPHLRPSVVSRAFNVRDLALT